MNKLKLKECQARPYLIMALILTYEDYVATTHTNRMIQFYAFDTKKELKSAKDTERDEHKRKHIDKKNTASVPK